MIEVEFYGEDTHQCDMCDQGAIIRITTECGYNTIHNIWLCEDHLKELYQKIDPLRVLVMTGKNIRME